MKVLIRNSLAHKSLTLMVLCAFFHSLIFSCRTPGLSGDSGFFAQPETSKKKGVAPIKPPEKLDDSPLQTKWVRAFPKKYGEVTVAALYVGKDPRADFVQYYFCLKERPSVCSIGPENPAEFVFNPVYYPGADVGFNRVLARSCVRPEKASTPEKACSPWVEGEYEQPVIPEVAGELHKVLKDEYDVKQNIREKGKEINSALKEYVAKIENPVGEDSGKKDEKDIPSVEGETTEEKEKDQDDFDQLVENQIILGPDLSAEILLDDQFDEMVADQFYWLPWILIALGSASVLTGILLAKDKRRIDIPKLPEYLKGNFPGLKYEEFKSRLKSFKESKNFVLPPQIDPVSEWSKKETLILDLEALRQRYDLLEPGKADGDMTRYTKTLEGYDLEIKKRTEEIPRIQEYLEGILIVQKEKLSSKQAKGKLILEYEEKMRKFPVPTIESWNKNLDIQISDLRKLTRVPKIELEKTLEIRENELIDLVFPEARSASIATKSSQINAEIRRQLAQAISELTFEELFTRVYTDTISDGGKVIESQVPRGWVVNRQTLVEKMKEISKGSVYAEWLPSGKTVTSVEQIPEAVLKLRASQESLRKWLVNKQNLETLIAKRNGIPLEFTKLRDLESTRHKKYREEIERLYREVNKADDELLNLTIEFKERKRRMEILAVEIEDLRKSKEILEMSIKREKLQMGELQILKKELEGEISKRQLMIENFDERMEQRIKNFDEAAENRDRLVRQFEAEDLEESERIRIFNDSLEENAWKNLGSNNFESEELRRLSLDRQQMVSEIELENRNIGRRNIAAGSLIFLGTGLILTGVGLLIAKKLEKKKQEKSDLKLTESDIRIEARNSLLQDLSELGLELMAEKQHSRRLRFDKVRLLRAMP